MIRFEEVAVRATKRWTENGKRRRETRKFWQTVSPFNKDERGEPKSRQKIIVEICQERDSWLGSKP